MKFNFFIKIFLIFLSILKNTVKTSIFCVFYQGYAEEVYEHSLGEDKYTFIEGVKNPRSCTILIKGPNEHTIAIIKVKINENLLKCINLIKIIKKKDAIRDGLRAVKNLIDDKCYIPGAGAFEIACYNHLIDFKNTVQGKAKLGVQAFAEALLIIPKVLAENSGYDVQDAIIELIDTYKAKKMAVGLNVEEFGTIPPEFLTIYDNYCVKKQFLNIAPTLAQQLLLVDEVENLFLLIVFFFY